MLASFYVGRSSSRSSADLHLLRIAHSADI